MAAAAERLGRTGLELESVAITETSNQTASRILANPVEAASTRKA